MGWSEGLPVLTALCLVLVSNIAGASSGAVTPSFTCDQIRELFEGDIGSPTALLSNPVYETESSICRRGRPAGEYSCCSADTENGFADLVEKKLKENVRVKNHGLKKHLNNILSRYQDRIKQLSAEAENRTSVFLSRLHKIPWAEHQPVVANLYKGIQTLVASGRVDSSSGDGVGGGVDDVVRDFFVNLFPAVYSYAMTAHEESGEQRRPISADYHACLKTYADQIQPFGNQPDRLLRQLRRSLRHAVVFEEAMKTLVDAMTSTAAATMDSSCRHALIRLQVCPGCRGVSTKRSVVKPCRGMCLNVMRGCLAKMSEISSSWDDLVVAFENLQIGMLGRHDLQKLLIYMDMNVSDAIMMATADSPRIYDEVRVKCQHVPRYDPNVNTSSSSSALLPLLPDSAAVSEAIAARSTSVLQTFRQEMKTLTKYLDDSKGQFNRLPDSLCQDEQVFAQDMLSDSCWNGTGVGRYMEQVPEANFLSQVQRNKEVKVSLVDPDLRFLQVKESLTHMRRNLSGLLNHEIMLGDSPRGGMMPYRSVSSEGSGGLRHQDVIVDDEDLVAYGSGSGSGSGDGGDDDGDGLSRSTDIPVTRRPSRPPPDSGSNPITVSALLLSVCLGLQSLVHARH